ncbi:MAG: uL15 family ribosomal protein [Candidatus Helarchaeota archaeon]
MAYKRPDKKIKKHRGSRTCGYGTQGQHRKGGQRGGRGVAGGKKHKRSYLIKYKPNYFGKHGFKRPPCRQYKDNVINLGKINNLIPKLIQKNIAKKEDKLITLNVSDIGYDKVLGVGYLKYPLNITAKKFSKRAIQKIQELGGKIHLLYEENEN